MKLLHSSHVKDVQHSSQQRCILEFGGKACGDSHTVFFPLSNNIYLNETSFNNNTIIQIKNIINNCHNNIENLYSHNNHKSTIGIIGISNKLLNLAIESQLNNSNIPAKKLLKQKSKFKQSFYSKFCQLFNDCSTDSGTKQQRHKKRLLVPSIPMLSRHFVSRAESLGFTEDELKQLAPDGIMSLFRYYFLEVSCISAVSTITLYESNVSQSEYVIYDGDLEKSQVKFIPKNDYKCRYFNFNDTIDMDFDLINNKLYFWKNNQILKTSSYSLRDVGIFIDSGFDYIPFVSTIGCNCTKNQTHGGIVLEVCISIIILFRVTFFGCVYIFCLFSFYFFDIVFGNTIHVM